MSCPETPREERPELLGFRRRPMVAWFDPRQLTDTAVRAGLSLVFGAYADKRELQAALKGPSVYDEFSGRDELWIDYVADLGDGYTERDGAAAKKWRLNPEAQGGEPWFEPAEGTIEAELIEGPIVLEGRQG